MGKKDIVQRLIEHTKNDYLSYFSSSSESSISESVVNQALSQQGLSVEMRSKIESMLPDTEDDGSWECSYALNTGIMLLCLIDYDQTGDEKYYKDAVEMFFDTVDFKVQQELETKGILNPTEDQILNHSLYLKEQEWFNGITKDIG